MTVNELQQAYNKTLEVISRGSAYMDDPDITIEKKEQALPAFRRLIDKLCKIANEIVALGIACTDNELVYGFKIGGG